MASAQSELDGALDTVAWGEDRRNPGRQRGRRSAHGTDEWRELLRRQLTSPVEFLDVTLRLPESVHTTIEMPPGGDFDWSHQTHSNFRAPVFAIVARRG